MNVVDSSAWIEFFTGGPNAKYFEPAILATEELVVPTMVLLEVYKHIRRHQGRDEALSAVAGMKQGQDSDFEGLDGVRCKRKPSGIRVIISRASY